MFLHLSVILFARDVRDGEGVWLAGGICGRRDSRMCTGATVAVSPATNAHGRGVCMEGGVHGRRVACVARGACGGCVWQGGMCGRRDGHCSGRYTSYWNVFLFTMEEVLSHWGFPVIHKVVNVGIFVSLKFEI